MALDDAKIGRPVPVMWVVLIIGVGFALLGYSAGLEDHKFYKPIIESLGDGLFLLGLIDLVLRNEVLSWLTKPSDLWEFNANVRHATEIFQKATEEAQLKTIAYQSTETLEVVKKILEDVESLKEQVRQGSK